MWASSAVAWPLSSAASPSSNGPAEKEKAKAGAEAAPDEAALEAARRALQTAPPDAVARALDLEIRRRAGRFLAGIAAYRSHPWRRRLADPPSVWSEGASRILDYAAAPGGVPVLFVPSLVNRATILDLDEDRSLMRFLAGQGIRPLLLDWGEPGATELAFDLTDVIAGRLERAVIAATEAAGRPVMLAGYCMGGLLTVAAAQRRPDLVSALILLATPWDFEAGMGPAGRAVAALGPLFEPWINAYGAMPVDLLQALFMAIDPLAALKKFSAFARLDPDSPRARDFVAVEDWLNDGVPLAAPIARECLEGWYGLNEPARRRWRVAGEIVDPALLKVPNLHLIPARDRIVPPQSAGALADAMPGAERLTPPLGHIGMIASARAREAAWVALASWISDRARRT